MLAALNRPQDGASLAVFRIAFGLVMLIGTCRYWAKGWIDSILVAPRFHFHYAGFRWVEPLAGAGMYLVFALMAASALGMLFAAVYRVAAWVFFATFTYVELCEKAAYLNHYYLVSLLALLLALFPSRPRSVPRFVLSAFRLQLGIVYFYAGLAKVSHDWLIDAQPLRIWLGARSDLPWVGPLLEMSSVAHAAAWLGMLFDLSAPWLLSFQRTRLPAYLALVAFHLATALLFPIGVFPWLMIASASLFFDPSWPRRLPIVGKLLEPANLGSRPAPLSNWSSFALAGYFLLQGALPARHLLYPGSPNWTDDGFRFAWRVMLIDKVGSVQFRVQARRSAHSVTIEPNAYLTPFQERMIAQSPDMMVELAQRIGADQRGKYGAPVAVYADAWVAMNGRPSQRLLNPAVDLMLIDWSDSGSLSQVLAR